MEKAEPVKEGEIKQLSGLQMPTIAEGGWVWVSEYPETHTRMHTHTHSCSQTVGANNSDKTEMKMKMKKTSEN